MTPEAAGHIRSRLRLLPAGEELALITVARQADIIDGREQVWFEGEHFMVSAYGMDTSDSAALIGGGLGILGGIAGLIGGIVGTVLILRRARSTAARQRMVRSTVWQVAGCTVFLTLFFLLPKHLRWIPWLGYIAFVITVARWINQRRMTASDRPGAAHD